MVAIREGCGRIIVRRGGVVVVRVIVYCGFERVEIVALLEEESAGRSGKGEFGKKWEVYKSSGSSP